MKLEINIKDALKSTREVVDSVKEMGETFAGTAIDLEHIALGVAAFIDAFIHIVAEREILYKVIIGLMLDSGLYDYEIDKNFIDDIGDFNLIVTTEDDKTKLSIVAPKKEVEE